MEERPDMQGRMLKSKAKLESRRFQHGFQLCGTVAGTVAGMVAERLLQRSGTVAGTVDILAARTVAETAAGMVARNGCGAVVKRLLERWDGYGTSFKLHGPTEV